MGKETTMPSATLTSKGQITLPKAIRDLLRLSAGDRVDFIVRELKGLLHRKGMKRLSVEAMNAVIRRRAAGRA